MEPWFHYSKGLGLEDCIFLLAWHTSTHVFKELIRQKPYIFFKGKKRNILQKRLWFCFCLFVFFVSVFFLIAFSFMDWNVTESRSNQMVTYGRFLILVLALKYSQVYYYFISISCFSFIWMKFSLVKHMSRILNPVVIHSSFLALNVQGNV